MTKEPTKTKTIKKDVSKASVAKLLPKLETLLEAGVHFGHERSKRNPKMERYIFMQRNRVAILDLEATLEKLRKAAEYIHTIAKVPSNEILFVGTKRQAREIVRRYAEKAGMPYVTKRWLGGTLTNFQTILKSIEKLDELKRTEDTPAVAKLTKKEKAVRQKEIERLEEVLEGIKSLKSLPTTLFVVGSHDERIAVREARRVGIPVVGISDSNADPELLDYPIPANDDAIRSIDLVVSVITSAIMAAKGKKLDKSATIQGKTKKEESTKKADSKETKKTKE